MTPELSPEAWLFDLDGTLVHSDAEWERSQRLVLTRLGLPVLGYYELIQSGAMRGVGVTSYAAAVLDYAGSSLDPRDVAMQICDELAAGCREGGFTMKPGARELLSKAGRDGARRALVTISPRPVVSVFTAYIGDVFDVTVSADDVEHVKPAPDAYLLAMQKLGVTPAGCVAVEDSPSGVASARAAGCGIVVGVGRRKDELLGCGADMVIASLDLLTRKG